MQKKCDSIEKVLLMKILQFLPKSDETLPKVPNHELVILTKFHWNWIKIAEFLLIVNFKACRIFFASDSRMLFLDISTLHP